MAEAQYDIVFSGEILDGFEPAKVKAQIARIFNLSAAKLEQLFSRHAVVLKSGLAADDAQRYQQALTRAGLKTALRRCAPLPGATHPAPAVSGQPESRPATERPAASPVTDAARDEEQAELRTLSFEFAGSGREFFRIWIVNVMLTIVTLGIYSAWAKVRTKRYFYGNTRLEGSSFEYLADPVKILKGRLIGFAFFALMAVTENLLPVLSALLSLAMTILMPWIIVQSMRFRARNSAWRNVTFGFDGTVGGAVKAFIGWPLLGVVTLGAFMPFAFYKQQRFLIENSRFGATRINFEATAKTYYMISLMAGLVFVGGFALAAGAGALLPPLMPVAMVAAYLVVFAYFTVAVTNAKYNNAILGDHSFAARYELKSYAWLMFTNTLGIVFTLGLFYPWAKVRTAAYVAGHVEFIADGDLDGFVADQHEQVSAIGQEVGDIFDVEFGI